MSLNLTFKMGWCTF